LLHLIRKNEVDIFDIPITIITDQYLEYIDMMKAFNINVAGDFLVMASTLIHIKSRLLLPETDEAGDEDDPREEITRPLLEYLQFKELAGELSERSILERDVFKRSPVNDYSDFEQEDVPLDVNLFQLMDAFKRILENNIPGAEITYEADRLSVKDRISFILDSLKEKTTLFFKELFNEDRTIAEFVVTFLAVLELVHIGLIKVCQPSMDNEIRLEARFEDDEEINYEQITEDDN
ncbi:segregation and condensation protein A, partial [Thermodesulfobacteriota bacterium]